jgi:hypothetical protein
VGTEDRLGEKKFATIESAPRRRLCGTPTPRLKTAS